MDIAFWSVLIAGLLPLACAGMAKFCSLGGERPGRYDNRDPRGWLARRQGAHKRANDAQANGWEAFPFFAVGVIVAHLQHVEPRWIDALAIVFVVARVIYIWFYISDKALLRSVAWSIGFLASIGLYLLAATGTLR